MMPLEGRGFESHRLRHVVADYESFATTFLLKSHRLTHAVACPLAGSTPSQNFAASSFSLPLGRKAAVSAKKSQSKEYFAIFLINYVKTIY